MTSSEFLTEHKDTKFLAGTASSLVLCVFVFHIKIRLISAIRGSLKISVAHSSRAGDRR